MNTRFYKVDKSNFDNLDKIVSNRKEKNFFRIEKAFEYHMPYEESLEIDRSREFEEHDHMIYLVAIDKKTFKEMRTPLAIYMGTENHETFSEEEILIQEANKRLYDVLKNDK